MKPQPKPHSCRDNGHVWLEPDGTIYTRHRTRSGTVAVTCAYCPAKATLQTHAKATMTFPQEVARATAHLRRDKVVAARIAAMKAVSHSAPAKIDS